MTALFEIRHLSYAFDTTAPYFFYNLSASFPANRLHFIKGKNGAGKSTLFRILQGMVSTHENISGTLVINGVLYELMPTMKLIQAVTSVPQQFDRLLADQFSFKQNLQFANMPRYPSCIALPAYHPLPSLVYHFGIDMDQPVRLLSGGQRQMLAILMALQHPAGILLLDEPTAALDEKNAAALMAFLQELLTIVPVTVLIISHDRELVETYAPTGYYELTVDTTTEQRLLRYRGNF